MTSQVQYRKAAGNRLGRRPGSRSSIHLGLPDKATDIVLTVVFLVLVLVALVLVIGMFW